MLSCLLLFKPLNMNHWDHSAQKAGAWPSYGPSVSKPLLTPARSGFHAGSFICRAVLASFWKEMRLALLHQLLSSAY